MTNKFKLFILTQFLIILPDGLVNAQEWKDGTMMLQDGVVPISGQFKFQHFAHLTSVFHLKEDGSQDTYQVGDLDWIELVDSENQTRHYEAFDFKEKRATIEPKILLEVHYSSDHMKLLSGDIRAIQRYFQAIPVPGLGILFSWGKRLTNNEVVFIYSGTLDNLTIINEINDMDYGIVIDKSAVLDQVMIDYKKDVKTFVKGNKLKWQEMADLVKIIGYYDRLKFLED